MGFEHIYNVMIGEEAPLAGEDIKDEFIGECEQLYEQVYNARIRLSQRLEGNNDGEEADCMVMVRCYERMMYLLCERAFEYGKTLGSQLPKI